MTARRDCDSELVATRSPLSLLLLSIVSPLFAIMFAATRRVAATRGSTRVSDLHLSLTVMTLVMTLTDFHYFRHSRAHRRVHMISRSWSSSAVWEKLRNSEQQGTEMTIISEPTCLFPCSTVLTWYSYSVATTNYPPPPPGPDGGMSTLRMDETQCICIDRVLSI